MVQKRSKTHDADNPKACEGSERFEPSTAHDFLIRRPTQLPRAAATVLHTLVHRAQAV